MDVVQIFREYIQKYQKHLQDKDWLLERFELVTANVQNRAVQQAIPVGEREVSCTVFFLSYEAKKVYVIQDLKGKKTHVVCLWDGSKMDHIYRWGE